MGKLKLPKTNRVYKDDGTYKVETACKDVDCPHCKALCVMETTVGTRPDMPAKVSCYCDCDCGFVSFNDGDRIYERFPNQKGVVWERHDRDNTVTWINDDESQRMIESRKIIR